MSGSRLDGEATCLRCGGIIIDLNPKLKMCSKCEKDVTVIANRQIKNRKSSLKKKIKLKVGSMHGIKLGSNR